MATTPFVRIRRDTKSIASLCVLILCLKRFRFFMKIEPIFGFFRSAFLFLFLALCLFRLERGFLVQKHQRWKKWYSYVLKKRVGDACVEFFDQIWSLAFPENAQKKNFFFLLRSPRAHSQKIPKARSGVCSNIDRSRFVAKPCFPSVARKTPPQSWYNGGRPEFFSRISGTFFQNLGAVFLRTDRRRRFQSKKTNRSILLHTPKSVFP